MSAVDAADVVETPTTRRKAAVGGATLKLYIDSTSLSVIHQMADFVACAADRSVIKLITWLRNPLDESRLAEANALYVKQLAAVTQDFVALVSRLVEQFAVGRLVIHSNHHHAPKAVLPVLRALLARKQISADQVELHLYDDGRLSVMQREELAALPDLQTRLDQGAKALHALAFEGQRATWDIPASYGWQRWFKTTYHMLRPELMFEQLARMGGSLDESLANAIVPMRFDHAERLGAIRWATYLEHYGCDAATRKRLRAFAAQPKAFLFVGTSVWDKATNARYCALQLSSIKQLRERGLLPQGVPIAFKGHPANRDHEATLMKALGDDVFAVPSRLPLEVMMIDGLLPPKLGGVISSAYLTLPPERLAFMLCDATTHEAALAQPDVRVLVDLGIIDADRALPWLT